jgi:hypothetical protein
LALRMIISFKAQERSASTDFQRGHLQWLLRDLGLR